MKGILFYYSGSGNTKLASQYLTGKLTNCEFELVDIHRDTIPDTQGYDVVAFATFCDHWGVPQRFIDFIESQQVAAEKPAFVFATYGFIVGKTLLHLGEMATASGFKVVEAHSFHTPESFPPLIARGMGKEKYPTAGDLKRFHRFIDQLDEKLGQLKAGTEVPQAKISIGMNRMLRAFPRTQPRKVMGEKYVDESLCTECGICKENCAYGAIELAPKPIFDMEKCYGCWACFNHCPSKAIYTEKFRGVGHYPRPHKFLVEKLQTPA